MGAYIFIYGKPVSCFHHHYGRLLLQTESCRSTDLPLKGKTLYLLQTRVHTSVARVTAMEKRVLSYYKLEMYRNLMHSKKQLPLSVVVSGS